MSSSPPTAANNRNGVGNGEEEETENYSHAVTGVTLSTTTPALLRKVHRQQQRHGEKQRRQQQQPEQNHKLSSPLYTSVSDYKTEQDLIHALTPDQRNLDQKQQQRQQQEQDEQEQEQDDHDRKPKAKEASSWEVSPEENDDTPVEWTLKVVDQQNSQPQTMEQEVQRLKILQSYFILDHPDAQPDGAHSNNNSNNNNELDRIPLLAKDMFQVPICLISLIDVGRQWFASRIGLPDPNISETPRKYAFCAHVVISKQTMLVVPDATKDIRFKNNPLVADPNGLQIRFYAGAALMSPEGYKLGTLCCIDLKPRSDFGVSQRRQLQSLAALVMQLLVARRDRYWKLAYEYRLRQVAQETLYTAEQQLQQVISIQQEEEEDRKQQFDEEELEYQQEQEQQEDSASTATTTKNNNREYHQQVRRQQASDHEWLVEQLQMQATLLAAGRRSILQELPPPAAATTNNLLSTSNHNTNTNTNNNTSDLNLSSTDRFEGFDELPSLIRTETIRDYHPLQQQQQQNRQQQKQQLQYQNQPTTDLIQLFTNINQVIENSLLQRSHSVQQQPPPGRSSTGGAAVGILNNMCAGSDTVIVELQKGTPQFIVAEDLLLFRSALNLIWHCFDACAPLPAKCGLRIQSVQDLGTSSAPELLLEAYHGPVPDYRDTTTTNDNSNNNNNSNGMMKTRMVTAQEAKRWFLEDYIKTEDHDDDNNNNKNNHEAKQSSSSSSCSCSQSSTGGAGGVGNTMESLLRHAAILVRSMGGRYGMFTGRWVQSSNQEGMEELKTIYWFRIPYQQPFPSSTKNTNKNTTIPKTMIQKHKISLGQKQQMAVSDHYHPAVPTNPTAAATAGSHNHSHRNNHNRMMSRKHPDDATPDTFDNNNDHGAAAATMSSSLSSFNDEMKQALLDEDPFLAELVAQAKGGSF